MRRFVSLLLIPLCLFGAPMPHSHHGTSVAEPNNHAMQPHLHLAGGHNHGHPHSASHGHRHSAALDHHHDHEEDSGATGSDPGVAPLTDHDADALYLTEQTSDGRRHVVEPPTGAYAMQAIVVDDDRLGRQEAHLKWAWPPPDADGGLPIYLRISSLRI